MNTTGKIAAIIGALLLAGVAGAITFTFIQNNPPMPKFSYNSTGINGWWSSENTNIQTIAKKAGNNYQGEPIDKLPIADLTVHHGEKGAAETPEDNCFAAFSYFDYPLENPEEAYEKYENRKEEQGDLEILAPIERTVTTFEGDKNYKLQQYNYTIEGEEVLSGYQVGFVEMEDGYIRVEGVCKTAEDLALTLPILEAVTLNER